MTIQAIAPQAAAPAPARQTASNAATLSSDFETFIRMLTAQARYQDPLEPLDSSQYATQLAQFSMVEQQVLANDRLAALFGGDLVLASMNGVLTVVFAAIMLRHDVTLTMIGVGLAGLNMLALIALTTSFGGASDAVARAFKGGGREGRVRRE